MLCGARPFWLKGVRLQIHKQGALARLGVEHTLAYYRAQLAEALPGRATHQVPAPRSSLAHQPRLLQCLTHEAVRPLHPQVGCLAIPNLLGGPARLNRRRALAIRASPMPGLRTASHRSLELVGMQLVELLELRRDHQAAVPIAAVLVVVVLVVVLGGVELAIRL